MQAKSYAAAEIASQPDCWRDAGKLAREVAHRLPRSGERIAVVGCGTSLFMAMAYSSLRESRGFGVTDAFPASEMPASRLYDRVLAITRSGTTTEILEVLDRKRSVVPTLVITGDSTFSRYYALTREQTGSNPDTVRVVVRLVLSQSNVDVADVVVTFVGRLALGTGGAGAAPQDDMQRRPRHGPNGRGL